MKTPDPNASSLPLESKAPTSSKRNPGILDSLSPEQREQLMDWLELHPVQKVLELVAAPPPDGFGIKTHITSLRRFHHQAQAANQKDLADEHCELLAELAPILAFHSAKALAAADVRLPLRPHRKPKPHIQFHWPLTSSFTTDNHSENPYALRTHL